MGSGRSQTPESTARTMVTAASAAYVAATRLTRVRTSARLGVKSGTRIGVTSVGTESFAVEFDLTNATENEGSSSTEAEATSKTKRGGYERGLGIAMVDMVW